MSQALIDRWRKEDAAGATAPTAAEGKDGSGVRAMFEASADLDAPRVARGLQLAQALGLPETVVLEQPEWAERETTARAVEKHPLLAKWAEQDRRNAAFARDDAEGLADVFEAVDGLNPQAPDPALNFEARERTGLELTRKARSGDEGARAELQRLRDEREAERLRSALRRTPNPSLLGQIPILLREGTDQVGKSMAGAIAMLAENLQSKPGEGALKLPEWASHGLREREEARNALLRAVARHVRQSVEERERTLPAPLRSDSTVGGWAQDVVRMAPQVLGQIGVTSATGGAGGMAFMGGQIAGGQYLDLTEKDVQPGRAAFAALANAGLQAPLEQIGLGRFMDIFKASGLGKVLLKTGEAVGTEMLTEYLQEYPEAATTIWAEAQKEGRTTEESVRHFLDQLGEIHRDGLYSAAVAAPFGLLGGAGRIATDAATAREAADFARRHKALHAKVEASQTRRLSPAHMTGALEAAGLTGTAHLPATDVLRLYQEGTDIITPLGWQARDVDDAAALGQDLEAPLSHLHARLDASAFNAVADIMRPEPGTMNAAEAAKLDERLRADVEDVNAAFAEYQEEQNAIDAEVELLRAEVAGAIGSVPNLKSSVASARLTPEATAETYVKPLLNFAERLREHAGLPVAETLRKLRVQGLVRDGKRLLTPDEMRKREEARAKGLFQENRNALAARFAIMPMIEADSSAYFGPGKEIDADRQHLRKALQDWAKTKFPPGITVQNADQGWEVQVSYQGVKKTLSHGYDTTLAKSVPLISQIIETGIHIAEGKVSGRMQTHIFANKIKLEGKSFVVGFVIREDQNGRRFYDHELTEIIDPDSLNTGRVSEENKASVTRANRGDVMNILRDKLGVNDGTGRILFQPLNEGVDLDAPVAVVEVAPRFAGQNPKVLRKRFPDDVRRAVLAQFESPEGVVNADTGWRIGMSARDFREHLKLEGEAYELEQLEAIAALPELMRSARLVESHSDKKTSKGSTIKKVHRFMSAMRLDNKDYAVMLTVKEFKDGSISLDTKNPVKLYHHRIEKTLSSSDTDVKSAMPTTTYAERDVEQSPPRSSADINTYTLKRLLEDVKDSEGQAFFQRSPAVVVRGDELGVPEGASIKEYQKAAREVYRGLQKTPAHREDLGEIRFTTAGFGKMLVSGADPRKWKLVPRLKEIIERADYIERRGLEKERKDEIVAFHWLEGDILLDGATLRVGLQIAEDRQGNKFYNLNQDLEAWREKYEAPDRADIGFGGQELLQDASASLALNIATPPDGVNLHILERQGGTADARGSIKPTPEGHLIQLYQKADLSTLLHEMGHFFLLEVDDAVRADLADDTLKADYAALRQWLKAEDGVELSREQHEQFARGFEAYLMEGKAPSASLESAFARFRKWLTSIYKKARALNVDLTDEVRGVFDRLLATEAEVNARAVENGLVDLTARELDANRAERNAIDAEMERIRGEIAGASAGVPGLKATMVSGGMSPEATAETYTASLLNFAERLREHAGLPVAETLRKLRVQGLVRDGKRLLTPDARTLFQPLNDGVDLDAPVAVVEVAPRFAGQNPKVLRKRFPDDVRRAVLAQFESPEGVVNADTGKRVGMSAKDFHEHLKFSDADAIGGLAQLEAVAALPDLMRTAKLVESYNDKKNVYQIKKMHRFQAALRIGDKDYSVKMTVKEYKDGELRLDIESPFRLYHHRLEKEMPAGNSEKAPSGVANRPSAGIHEYSLRALLEDVKDSEGQAFFQRGPAVVVRGDELGVPEGASIKEYQKAAREVYRGLQKTPAHREDLGEIRFTGDGFREMKQAGADPRKWRLVPCLKEIVESAEYIRRNALTKKRKDDIVAFHWLETDVQLNGRNLRVGLHVAEDSKGNKFYNLNHDLKDFKTRREALAGHLENNRGPQTELLQDASASLALNIATPPDGVNLHILERQGGTADARGSIKPTPEGHLIQLYQKADLSTLLHEMGHFFLLEVDDAVRAGLADDTLKADYAALRQWLKAEDGAELSREQHEQFARGFEAYLMEGKAPSASLESAFGRFKKWLTRIYKKARALNVDLTDEVRGVFDRLLSTEAEVNARAVENGLVDLTARELDALGLKGAERASVSGLMRAACDAAEARMRADRDRQRREQLVQWKRDAAAEVNAMPVYGAMTDARSGGLDLEAVRQDMGEDYAARLMRRLPGAFRKEGGADPAIFAAEHGFTDPAAMFTAMLDAPKKGDLIRRLVDDKQRAWDANFDPADYLLETDEAARHLELVGQYAARALGGQVADQRALKRVAAARLAAMSMGRATRPGTYRMNMRRALAAERRAIVKGEWQAALEANFQARINMEFARQSLDLKRSVETLQGRIKRFTGMAKADPDARFLVGALAQRHGLGKLDARLPAEERQNPGDVLAAWIEAAKADGCPVIMDNAFARPDLPWRDLSVEAFEELAETIRQIVTVERNRRKLLTARNKADLDEAAEEIAAGVAAFRETAPVKTVEKENAALKSLKGLHAAHTMEAKVEALCLALDGDRRGPMWEYVYRPIITAEDERSGRLRAAREKLRGLFGVFSRKELSAMRLKREYVDSVREKLTRENMLTLALNMGNETNIARVREGHKWTDTQISDVLSRLTRKDWEFVQSVWDYFETFKAESFKLQEDITGLRPQAVEAKPLTVATADGHTLTLRGGYFPITYNAEKGFMAYEREQRELNKELFGGNSHSAARTRQGHLKERAAKGTGEPLLLELSVVTDHVFNVIHDLSYRRAVLDVAKVIRHPVVREALTGAVGMDMYNQLKPWLMDVANERQEPMHAVHRWANWARASTSIMQMGLKVTTMLAQPLGITQTAEVLGYGYTALGLKKVYAHPLRLPELLEETFARSPMMADRIRSFDREIRDMTKKLMPSSGLFGWVDTVRDSAFVPIGVMQMGVDLPTWWGGYAKGLRDFQGDEARAAEYADSVVRLSQGGGATKDPARVRRGEPLPRLFTMFYSYFNTFYHLAARRVTGLRRDHSPAAVFRAANTALLLWFVPAVLGELMAGRGPDDDDETAGRAAERHDEAAGSGRPRSASEAGTTLPASESECRAGRAAERHGESDWAGMLVMQYPFQAVVGVRDVANHIFGEYGYHITPAQTEPTALGQWFKSVNKALESAQGAGRLVKPTVEAAGYLFGLPMKQPIITVGNIWDYLTGEDPEFEVRDLFFAKPRDRR